jgi:hypothetical protein
MNQQPMPMPMPLPEPEREDRRRDVFAQMTQVGQMLEETVRQRARAPVQDSSRGVITRLVGDSVGYVRLTPSDESLGFLADAIPAYRGEDWEEHGFFVGVSVDVVWEPATRIVREIKVVSREEPAGRTAIA